MFYSRLARRVRALRLPDFASYCDYLRRGEDPGELTELINAVTTNLTAFFRENHHFEYLRDHAIPERMEAAGGERRIRIWSAGCSTGEEPYSLGMTVGEMQGMVRVKPELRERIDFGLLNLMQDWRREPQDIIFCRNVIIYFDKESKRRLIDRFADTIKPGGFLFIGHSESLFQVSERFELIGKTIYRRVR